MNHCLQAFGFAALKNQSIKAGAHPPNRQLRIHYFYYSRRFFSKNQWKMLADTHMHRTKNCKYENVSALHNRKIEEL